MDTMPAPTGAYEPEVELMSVGSDTSLGGLFGDFFSPEQLELLFGRLVATDVSMGFAGILRRVLVQAPVKQEPLALPVGDLHSLPGQLVGLGLPVPSERTLVRAERFIRTAYSVVDSWGHPHLTSEGERDVALEWCVGRRSLSIHFNDVGDIEYLRASGPDPVLDVAEGSVRSAVDFPEHWAWLHEG